MSETNTTLSVTVPEEEAAALMPHWHAADRPAVGQIHLMDNPLLTDALRPKHINSWLEGSYFETYPDMPTNGDAKSSPPRTVEQALRHPTCPSLITPRHVRAKIRRRAGASARRQAQRDRTRRPQLPLLPAPAGLPPEQAPCRERCR